MTKSVEEILKLLNQRIEANERAFNTSINMLEAISCIDMVKRFQSIVEELQFIKIFIENKENEK